MSVEASMDKVNIGKQAFLYPMPVVIVGAVVDGKPNFMAVAWVTRTNFRPPIVGIALGRAHHTNQGIHAHREFSISIPSRDLLLATDYVGIMTGAKTDKSHVFETFTGELRHAPMVQSCPVAMECRLVQVVEQPTNEFFFGEVVNVYADQSCLVDGVPDIEKIAPFALTMPDNRYWSIGGCIGRAWSDGKKHRVPV